MEVDNRLYYIIDLQLYIKGMADWLSRQSEWEKFSGKLTENTDIDFQILHHKSVDYELERFQIPEGYSYLLRYESDVLMVNKAWNSGIFLTPKVSSNLPVFLNHIFYSNAIHHHILQCHSSLIEYKEAGLMFLGPSGIGKTTQAELWNKYRDALIINGDIVFVQETSDTFLGWGTPWHGSSPYCENTNVPVKALIVLKQAPENSIRELTGFEKVTAVSNNVFYPRWLENGMELCLETLDHLLTALPVYELSCRPDEDAVKLTEETIFGK